MPDFEGELLKHRGPSLLKDGLHFMAFGAQAIAQVSYLMLNRADTIINRMNSASVLYRSLEVRS